MEDLHRRLEQSNRLTVHNKTRNESYAVAHKLTPRQVRMILAGSLINMIRARKA